MNERNEYVSRGAGLERRTIRRQGKELERDKWAAVATGEVFFSNSDPHTGEWVLCF